jgi:hypothetical protein
MAMLTLRPPWEISWKTRGPFWAPMGTRGSYEEISTSKTLKSSLGSRQGRGSGGQAQPDVPIKSRMVSYRLCGRQAGLASGHLWRPSLGQRPCHAQTDLLHGATRVLCRAGLEKVARPPTKRTVGLIVTDAAEQAILAAHSEALLQVRSPPSFFWRN